LVPAPVNVEPSGNAAPVFVLACGSTIDFVRADFYKVHFLEMI
jgi:hypothetical protein